MRINPIINSYKIKSFGAKSKEMRNLDDANRSARAQFNSIPSSSFYLMKLQDVYKNPNISLRKKMEFQENTNDLLIRTIMLRNELEGAETIDEIMALVQKYKIANCGEMSLYLQEKLKSVGYDAKRISLTIARRQGAPVGRYKREMFDHVFVLVNDKKDADWQQPKTWGSKAIILDPWTGVADYKDEAITKIKNYLKVDPENEYLLFDRCFSDIECR
ncbi:hypothetical protein IKA92_07135 [bacterium]|nr:hypothetical protein [bacterium]